MIAVEMLKSPCCRRELREARADALACAGCGHAFAIERFGPDLMPPDAERGYASYGQWRAVQVALTAWRQRTWTGSADAAAANARTTAMAERFIAWARPRGTLIDVGCGSGWIAGVMPQVAYHGADPMPLDHDYAFPFVRALSDCLPFGDGAFDTCFYWSSIDYAIDIGATIAEAHRVLKPGGLMAVATPIHLTREVQGERLHNYRFLAGDLERLIAPVFGAGPETLAHSDNYHFIRVTKAA